ncbi:MAG: flagellar basal body-associated FliL family protein [Methylococcales bacterium]
MAEIQQEGAEKKSSKKLIIIILAVVLLLAGGGGAAYFFLLKGAPAEGEHAEAKDAKHEEAKHEAEHEELSPEEAAAAAEKIYYDLPKPLVVNLPKGTGAKFVMIATTFLVQGADTVDVLKKNEPMIRNNLLMIISAQNAQELKTREGKDKLRAAMNESVSAVLTKMTGKSRLKEIFFTSFVMQ